MSSSLNRLLKNTVRSSKLIVTPIVDDWLVKNLSDGLVLDDELFMRLRGLLTTEQRDRTKSWSASARGSCQRAQVFQYIGTRQTQTVDARLANIFLDGTWRHLRWQMMGLKAGFLTDVEVPIRRKGLNLKGSLDGVGDIGGPFGFELKGTSRMPKEPMEAHVLQIHSYFLGMPKLERFSLVYEDKRSQDWREFVIEKDPDILKEALDELTSMQEHVESKTLPMVLPECMRQTGVYQRCPFKKDCLAIMSWEEAEELAE